MTMSRLIESIQEGQHEANRVMRAAHRAMERLKGNQTSLITFRAELEEQVKGLRFDMDIHLSQLNEPKP